MPHLSARRCCRAALALVAPLLSLVPVAAARAQTAPAPAVAAPRGAAPPAAAALPQAPGQLAGTVVRAADGQPVEGAGITVRATGDSALVGGAVTGADGTFRIQGLRAGRYTVRARAVGFAPLVRADVAISAERPRAELGTLALAAVATQLAAVSVQAERSTETLAPDRNSYTVKDMPTTSGGTAVDVLRNIPAVEVDGDNNVSLRGNGNVVVQINGRISPLRGAQLGNFLAQLPANLVAKVEVVSNPSAKNDPEGLAGILNIVLKEQTDLGTSGGVNASGVSTGQASASGNLGYQGGPWTLFGSYGFMRDRRTVDGLTTRDALAGSAAAGSALDADVHGVMHPESHTATASAEYRITARDGLANNLVLSRGTMARDNASFYRAYDASGALTGRLDQQTADRNRDLSLDYALTWRHIVDQQKNALTTELRYTYDHQLSDERFASTAFAPDGTPGGGSEPAPVPERDDTHDAMHVLFAQSDWTRALGAATKLETGYKGTFRQEASDFDVVQRSAATGAWEPDLGRSNTLAFREQINAAYGVLSQRVGHTELQAGLRAEQADTRLDLATTGERHDGRYASLFPSAIASYTSDDGRQLKASYSKRIARPSPGQLNPFGFREDAFTIFTGNPALRPEYTHAFELGYQQSLSARGRPLGTLQLTPFYRHTVDAVRRITTTGDDGVLRLAFANAATNDQYGADANVSLRRGRFNGFGGASAFEQVTDATNLDAAATSGRVRAFGWSVRGNATLKVTPTLDLQGFAMYRAPMRTEQGRITRMSLANVALRQKLRGEQATLTLRVIDPFGTMGWGVASSDGRVAQWSERHFGARGASLGFSYTFGRQPKLRPQPVTEPEAAPAPPGGP